MAYCSSSRTIACRISDSSLKRRGPPQRGLDTNTNVRNTEHVDGVNVNRANNIIEGNVNNVNTLNNVNRE